MIPCMLHSHTSDTGVAACAYSMGDRGLEIPQERLQMALLWSLLSQARSSQPGPLPKNFCWSCRRVLDWPADVFDCNHIQR